MSAGMQKLVAIGAQDVHLVGNPEISFFNSSYKRYSNFSQSVEKLRITGIPTQGGMSSIKIDKLGDLLGYVYLSIDNGTKAVDFQFWTRLIKSVEVYIGGQLIDTQDTIFVENCSIDFMANTLSKSYYGSHPGFSGRSYFYPFRFFFCENVQSSLPLCALQYQDVEIRIYWSDFISGGVAPVETFFWEAYGNFFYLDNDERASMSKRRMDMLITQVQKTIGSGEAVQHLTFNHPVKALINSNVATNGTLNSVFNKVKFSINGQDIIDYRWAKPHMVDVSAYYHTNNTQIPDVFFLPFCLSVTQLQPTGCLNFSRIQDAKITVDGRNSVAASNKIIIDPTYAISYNILRFENGMAGIMYAN